MSFLKSIPAFAETGVTGQAVVPLVFSPLDARCAKRAKGAVGSAGPDVLGEGPFCKTLWDAAPLGKGPRKSKGIGADPAPGEDC